MKKLLCLVVTVLMLFSLVLAGCGQAAAPTTSTTPTTTSPASSTTPTTPAAPTVEPPQQEAVTPTADAPKYGGTLTLALAGDITGWDPVVRLGVGSIFQLIGEPAWRGDWAKGPAGTGESDWMGFYDRFYQKIGAVAFGSGWSFDASKNTGTLVYQIRPGIRFAINPPPWAEAA